MCIAFRLCSLFPVILLAPPSHQGSHVGLCQSLQAIIKWAFGGSTQQTAAEGAAGSEAGAAAGMEQQTVSCIKVDGARAAVPLHWVAVAEHDERMKTQCAPCVHLLHCCCKGPELPHGSVMAGTHAIFGLKFELQGQLGVGGGGGRSEAHEDNNGLMTGRRCCLRLRWLASTGCTCPPSLSRALACSPELCRCCLL